ncbi:hypothetical protein UFOVP1382_3 [uncultured Caudovirales phage]|uniref:Uncharacterized protein n=1 Tax=uncultured Caudovirales phage TaxID=2100421 RepID=A0A6J5S0C2_9CAUD|nr:hypothetical protein UFOVP1382_3 [uncultured Caudovirales phage]
MKCSIVKNPASVPDPATLMRDIVSKNRAVRAAGRTGGILIAIRDADWDGFMAKAQVSVAALRVTSEPGEVLWIPDALVDETQA